MIFSIIIATCGRPERLGTTLGLTARAIKASGQPHRIIVVDNHPDYTAERVAALTAEQTGVIVKYLKTKPRDKSRALNEGIRVADTEWLAFTDDDTLPDVNWLRNAAACAEQSGWRVFAGQIISDDMGHERPAWLKPGKSGRVPAIGGAVVQYAPLASSGTLRFSDPVPYGANVFVRRDVFETFGAYDETLWSLCGKAALGVEDGEFGIRLKNAGEPIGYCCETIVVHPVHFDRCKLGIQLKLAFHYGWRDPIVFFDPYRPPFELFRLRLVLREGWRGLQNAFKGDPAAAVADLILAARSLGALLVRMSFAYQRRVRASVLADLKPASVDKAVTTFMCPACGADTLTSTASEVKCNRCDAVYRIANGVPVFTERADFYWGELPRERMRALIESPGDIEANVRNLIASLEAGLRGYLWQYANDPTRAGWKLLTALPANGVALDYGCGWGSLTLSLADSMKQVVAVDLVPERVELTVRRAREAVFTGVTGCVTGGIPRLPFPDHTFDLVVINGVLEWLPEAFTENPRHIQIKFLQEVCRVLKSTGQVYIGIENRYGAFYFIGRREEHTKLRFISLLPRMLAHLYHRLALGRPYRAYTYGMKSLKTLLNRAGMRTVKFYIPYPDYREFMRMVDPLDRHWFMQSFKPRSRAGRVAFKIISLFPGTWKLMSSFSIVAARGKEVESLLSRLILHLVAQGGIKAGVKVESYKLTRTGTVQVVLGPADRRILTLSLCPEARRQIKQSVAVRAALVGLGREQGFAIHGLMPALHSGCFESVEFKLDDFSSGTPWRERVEPERFYGASVEWLRAFHGARTRKGAFDYRVCMLGMRDAESRVAGVLPVAVREQWLGNLKRLGGAATMQTLVHGDFHRNNILFGSSGEIDRVIDWDLSLLQGLPVWDVMALFCADYFRKGGAWSEAYFKAAEECLGKTGRRGVLERYYGALGLERDDVWYGVLTFPVVQLRNKLEAGLDRRESVILDGLGEVMGRVAGLR